MYTTRISLPLVLAFSLLFLCYVEAADTLTTGQSIRTWETIVSTNGVFELGFFNVSDSVTRYYVGIWYRRGLLRRALWVANREAPLTDASGSLTIGKDENLAILDRTNTTVWTTAGLSSLLSSSSTSTTTTEAVLLNTGNLVLRGGSSNQSKPVLLWQSFDYPTDTLFPGMKIGLDSKNNKSLSLVSWRGDDDPSPGLFSFGIDPQTLKDAFIWRNSKPIWRSLSWNYGKPIGDDISSPNFQVISSSIGDDQVHMISYTDRSSGPEKRGTSLVLSPYGQLLYIEENFKESSYDTRIWSRKEQMCSVMNNCLSLDDCRSDVCGAYSSCSDDDEPICKCLPGFKPVSGKEWDSGKWDAGCVQSTASRCRNDDGFVQLKKMKIGNVPLYTSVNSSAECKAYCLRDCACVACSYGVNSKSDCALFHGELKGLQELGEEDEAVYQKTSSIRAPVELHVRVAASELDKINGGKRCPSCGANIIPYPLSTGPNCGDPAYRSFSCNTSIGELRFQALDGVSYPVTSINAEELTFVIQPRRICWPNEPKSRDLRLNSTQPFQITRRNTILLLSCSDPPSQSSIGCTSSEVCGRYMSGDNALCFTSRSCCSYVAGRSSLTSHSINIAGPNCSGYTSFVNANLSLLENQWLQGVEVSWKPTPEPLCDSSADCTSWPNSGCSTTRSGQMRCTCNAGFQWDPFQMMCTGGEHDRKKWMMPLIASLAAAIVLLGICMYFYRRNMLKRRNEKRISSGPNVKDFFYTNKLDNDKKDLDVTFYRFETISAATKNFNISNKLGQGGFGVVYKGQLPGGQEIAVKRLSRNSGQGLEEFKNEVILIAKLQHRNLVRLLGYCIHEDEKILLYEYMPNNSLDSFIFDQERRKLLDWEKRFLIILGIARGLLYLHHDSRLRIIHRDLKTSNILLDEEMNPKISDFGLARIFGGNQTQENTNRVVGTYGYMSPEYASHGLFSMKSDVFSFGVILLEIICGKKNNNLYVSEHSLTLLGDVWEQWKANGILNLMDPFLAESCNSSEVMKCFQIALLCVQEDAADRPSMTNVVAFFINETASLPQPNRSAFALKTYTEDISNGRSTASSKNEITMTTLEGR
ncbi:hypothetical protein H6P81_004822 [Aristolochia fimbriata]|uniref:non-specific serine/threonine protein kinase n=1 Tax=Aristolochia fimbriata TaxID=158543 RepID=A0AAV7ET89_ARIFI|nr:hypothetical protein H6P81_004822 [Aristolochia fimbriata]